MNSINYNRSSIINQTMGAFVGYCRICVIKMFRNILIALDAGLFAFFIFSVEIGTNFLPGSGGQDISLIIYDGGWKGK